MAALPRLIPAKTKAQNFGGVTYHVGTDAAPVLTVEVSQTPIYFEHHTLLWKHPAVKLGLKAVAGGAKRAAAGAPVFFTETKGSGMVALSRDGPGRVVPMHLPFGREIEVREHQFLAATNSLSFSTAPVKGPSSLLHGGQTYFIDKFGSQKGDGVLWVYAYGALFETKLAEGESIDVEPGAWVYKESTVRMEAVIDRLSSGNFGAHLALTLNRFTGPGRLGVQSMNAQHAAKA